MVEGQTEETFVKTLLVPHLAQRSISAYVRCVQTSRKRNIKHRGGLTRYAQARGDVCRWMREQRQSNVWFTTMFDLFRLPADFPGYDVPPPSDPRERVVALQQALLEDIGDRRLVPYIQLHEFGALVLADPEELAVEYPASARDVIPLAKEASEFDSPELIDGEPDTAPSKRILKAIPAYSKVASGPTITARIGLGTLRVKCPHFGAWLDRLESLRPA